MHCGVMLTGYNQGDWERLLREDYTRPPTVSDAANMDDTLYMGELVEPLGFDSIWATEHYGSAYSMQPNPLQYLAYWAGRTTRVDVGTAVIVASWSNPVRLQTADVGVADASLAARRATQPIGTPDEIIEKIRTLQHALSLEMVVIHMFYGGMPRAKAEKSLQLFAEKVLPAVQAMPTPINPDSLGQPGS